MFSSGAFIFASMANKIFTIKPIINGKELVLQVEKVETTTTTETYRIDTQGHVVVLRNNRLLFRGKGLKSREGWWKVIEGSFKFERAKEAICKAIEKADPE
jgi:hypothetical protein